MDMYYPKISIWPNGLREGQTDFVSQLKGLYPGTSITIDDYNGINKLSKRKHVGQEKNT